MSDIDIFAMTQAIHLAKESRSTDLPIGAVIVDGSRRIVATAVNEVEASGDKFRHAEIIALQKALLLTGRDQVGSLTMAVTLEPCPMCAWAAKISGIGKVVFGAWNPNYGAAGSKYDLLRDTPGAEVEVVGGVLAEQCEQMLHDSFKKLRHNL